MTDNEATFLDPLKEAYRQSSKSMVAPASPESCLSMPRIARSFAEGWREEDLAHVANCGRCQQIVAAEFRAECPDYSTLVHFAAGDSPFRAAFARHLEQDCEGRCRRRLDSAWVQAAGKALRAATITEAALQGLLGSLVSADVHLSAAPAFLPAGADTAIQIHAVCANGLIKVTLREEGPRLAAYIESPDTSVAGRTITLELLGKTRISARVLLAMVDGVGSFGQHQFGKRADIIASVGPDFQIQANFDPS